MAAREQDVGVALCGLALLAALAGCGRPSDPAGESLWIRQSPSTLIEERRLTAPAAGGNRFLLGWVGERRAGRVVYCPSAKVARLEITSLEQRPRELSLHLEGAESITAGSLRAAADGHDLGTVPLGSVVSLRLPADLPLGRLAIDLQFVGGTGTPCVAGAELRPVLPAGLARLDAQGALEQAGTSVVEFVRPRAAHDSRIVVDFAPPLRPAADQSFEVRVEDGDGRALAGWRWPQHAWQRWWPRRTSARLALEPGRGFLRCRLIARGAGSPGRWLHVALAPQDPAPDSPPDSRPDSPPDSRTTRRVEPPRRVPPKRIFVFVLDALRADFVGHHDRDPGRGLDATPTIDRLAAEGRTFLQHHSVAPNTLPSTKALFTGRPSVTQGGRKLPADGPPGLAELLRGAGYRTGLFSGNENVSATFGMERGFDFDAPDIKFGSGGRAPAFNDNAAEVYRAARSWLRGLPAEQPAFLYLHTIHPHNPYDPPPDLRRRFTAGVASDIAGSDAVLRGIDRGRVRPGGADRERLRRLYAAGLAYNDRELDAFLRDMTAGYAPGEVAVVITADHGEELFDHGGVLHGYTLYEEMLHIPLVVWWPGRLGASNVTSPTDTLDLHATLLALAGVEAKSGGESLLELGARDERADEVSFAAASSVRGGIFSARSPRFKVILAPRTGLEWGMGGGPGRSREPEYVFDLENDPQELRNLAGERGPRMIEVDWLRARLLDWIARHRDADAAEGEATEPVLSDESRRRLRALGYLE